MFCGQVWSCAVCSSVIRSERAARLKAECERYAAAGGMFVMLTLTMRHGVGDSLRGERVALAKAWASLRHSAAFRLLQTRIDGFVSATEVTRGENGWHLHKHVLFFVPGRRPGTPALPDAACGKQAEMLLTDSPTTCLLRVCGMIRPLSAVWCRLIEKHTGKEPIAERAFDMQIVDSGIGVYLSKIGDEMVRADAKDRSPFALLDDGEEESLELFVEYADAMKGAHTLEYSKGLRALLGAGLDVSDQELVGLERGGVVVETFPASTWRRMCDHCDVRGVSDADRRMIWWEVKVWLGLVEGVVPDG